MTLFFKLGSTLKALTSCIERKGASPIWDMNIPNFLKGARNN